MDATLRQELEEILDNPPWPGERFHDRDLSEAEKWQIAHWAANEHFEEGNGNRNYTVTLLVLANLATYGVILYLLFNFLKGLVDNG